MNNRLDWRATDFTELADRIAYKIQSLLTKKYKNSLRIASGIIKQELEHEARMGWEDDE